MQSNMRLPGNKQIEFPEVCACYGHETVGKQSDTSLQTDWSYERTNKGEAGELISLWEKCNQFPSIYQWNTDKIGTPLAAGINMEFKCGNYTVSHCAPRKQRDIILKWKKI